VSRGAGVGVRAVRAPAAPRRPAAPARAPVARRRAPGRPPTRRG